MPAMLVMAVLPVLLDGALRRLKVDDAPPPSVAAGGAGYDKALGTDTACCGSVQRLCPCSMSVSAPSQNPMYIILHNT